MNIENVVRGARSETERSESTRAIVMTGATGFVGGALLPELLKRDERPIICLVRATSAEHAAVRGRGVLQHPRVTWLRADIEETQLGLTDQTWGELAAVTSEIFHCAASTTFDLPLDEAQRINVDGTLRLLELASAAADFDRFHHVSTAYAAGVTDRVVGPDYRPADRAANFRNTYERTKARAERHLVEQTSVAVSIYRPSIVAGHTVTGTTTNWNVLYGPMRMITKGQLPMLPCSGDARVDTVGVDYVARGIARLSSGLQTGHTSHHLVTGLNTFSVHQYIDACVAGASSQGTPTHCRPVSHRHWRRLELGFHAARRVPRRTVRRRARIGLRGMQGFAPYLPYTAVSCVFDNTADITALAESGIVMPPAAQYLETIIGYATDSDFGRASAVERSTLEVVA